MTYQSRDLPPISWIVSCGSLCCFPHVPHIFCQYPNGPTPHYQACGTINHITTSRHHGDLPYCLKYLTLTLLFEESTFHPNHHPLRDQLSLSKVCERPQKEPLEGPRSLILILAGAARLKHKQRWNLLPRTVLEPP
jgi:hypothetical protein